MHDAGDFTMDRRGFLLATMGSALLLLNAPAQAAPGPKNHAALRPLAPDAVKPRGWLRAYMVKQAKGLGSNLERTSWPFTEPYWKGDDRKQFWWPFEQKAYWVDGAARLAIVLDDEALRKQVGETVDYTLAHIENDGFIGAPAFRDPKAAFHRWPGMIFFRALEAVEGTHPEVVEAMTAHFLLDDADYGKPARNVTNIEPMLWCYERTGDRRLLALAEKAWADFLTVAADPEHGDLSKARVFANAPIQAHGVTYIETAKQPALLYAATGKREYLDFALAAQKRILDHHMLVDGIPSTSEQYRTTTALDCHETCDIADHAWAWSHLLAVTGDGAWGDRVERAVFNAAPGAVKDDWKALQYFSCPNQFIATLDSSHVSLTHPEYGIDFMAYRPNPGGRTACCGGNVHRILPNYAMRMWMRTPENGLAATLYGPSTLTTTVGPQAEPITIVQTTDYPFDETIALRLDLKRATAFPLRLRIPAWCKSPGLALNGKPLPLPPVKDGFVTLNRTFHPGDTLTLILPMTTAATRWPDNGVALERGPLVYALPIETEWSAVVQPTVSTPDFPSWNATPTSAWNYALDADPDAARAVFERKPMTDDPWSHPPVTLKVQARRVEGWTLRESPKNPAQRFTPSLPDLAKLKPAETAETLTLVPYGATHLRLTVFPELPKG